jgi:uncharacterized protein (DUF2249 family)
MSGKTVQLDVREDIRNGREPFGRILATAQKLGPTDRLKLLAPFEPMPLYTFLGNVGFLHSARELADGSWEIFFERHAGVSAAEPVTCNLQPETHSDQPTPNPSKEGKQKGHAVVSCDVRRLAPPEPMVKILEALALLPAGAELLAHTDRRPMHLYPQLEARGFCGETEAQSDGSFLTRIRHA